MSDITWKIESTDPATGSMLVAFTRDEKTTVLNLPLPPSSTEDLGAFVMQYSPPAPVLADFLNVAVGATGSGAGRPTNASISEEPNTTGSWNEEYLRAMIYQVLEEVRESEA